MSFGLNLRALFALARVAIAAILLVGVPLGDAAACSGEDAPALTAIAGEQAAGLPDGPAHDTQQPSDAQHCVHGHCHPTAAWGEARDIAQPIVEARIDVVMSAAGFVLPRVSSGLERPPKA